MTTRKQRLRMKQRNSEMITKRRNIDYGIITVMMNKIVLSNKRKTKEEIKRRRGNKRMTREMNINRSISRRFSRNTEI